LKYINFVKKGIVFSTTPSSVVKLRSNRQEIWLEAIKQGLKATEIQTGKNYSDIYHNFKKKL